MKDGSTYVLDVTGAQYGWHEYVMPWQSYNISRIREVLDVRPFGGTTLYWKSKTTELGGLFQWRVGITDCFALEVTGAVVWWQRHNISLNTLLRLPEHEFLKNKASLLNRVDDILQRSKAFRESRGYFEVNGGFKHGAERANDRIETGMEFTLLRDEFRGSWDTMSG